MSLIRLPAPELCWKEKVALVERCAAMLDSAETDAQLDMAIRYLVLAMRRTKADWANNIFCLFHTDCVKPYFKKTGFDIGNRVYIAYHSGQFPIQEKSTSTPRPLRKVA